MALILLISALVLGAALTRWTGLPLYPFEAVALTVVLGLSCWTWLALLAALVLPYAAAIPLTVLVGGLVSAARWYPLRRERPEWARRSVAGTSPLPAPNDRAIASAARRAVWGG